MSFLCYKNSTIYILPDRSGRRYSFVNRMDHSFILFIAQMLYDDAIAKDQEFLEFEQVKDNYISEAQRQFTSTQGEICVTH